MKIMRLLVSLLIVFSGLKAFAVEIPVTRDSTKICSKGDTGSTDAIDDRSTANGRE